MKVKKAITAAVVATALSGGLAACGSSSDDSAGSSNQAVAEQAASEETPDGLQQMLDWQSSMASDTYVLAVVSYLGELEMFEGDNPGDVGINMDGCDVIPGAYQAMIDNAPPSPIEPDTFKQAQQAYLEGINQVCAAVSKWDMDWKQYAGDKVEATFNRSEQLQEKWYSQVRDQVPELADYSPPAEWQSPWDPQWYN